MLAQKYNGKGAPRIVLFSPIAHQDLKDPNLPDGQANNARLALYTAAMAEVTKGTAVTFVDLFTPTKTLLAGSGPLTINGIHLNEAGNKAVAEIIDKALFGDAQYDEAKLAKLRQAVRDKNLHWFKRYQHHRRLQHLRRSGVLVVRRRANQLRRPAARTENPGRADRQPRSRRSGPWPRAKRPSPTTAIRRRS